MRCWRSRGSSRFGRFGRRARSAVFLGVLFRLVLIDLTSFPDIQEIRSALQKADGVEKVTPVEEAPGVITWEVQSDAELVSLVEKLTGIFGTKYTFRQKTLSNGTVEINVTKERFTRL